MKKEKEIIEALYCYDKGKTSCSVCSTVIYLKLEYQEHIFESGLDEEFF